MIVPSIATNNYINNFTDSKNMKKLKLFGMSAILCAMSLPGLASAQGTEPVFYGYQGDMFGEKPRGMFAFTPTGTTTDMLWRDQLSYNADGSISTINMLGGWLRDGRLCGYESYYPVPSLDYYKYIERDLLTGEVLLEKNVNTAGNSWNNIFLYATYCPVDDRVYGYGFNKSRTKFVFKSAPASDLDQAVIIKVCNQYKDMARSLCFNAEQGILVGINGNYELVQIDVNTGDQTLLYKPALNPAPDYDITSGLIWLPSRQAYAWNFYTVEADNNVSTFKLLDPIAKTATDLRSFPVGYNFNYFVAQNNEPVASTSSPAACTGLAAHFTGTDTKGNFTFTLPTKLNNGSDISGNVNYQLYVDNEPTLSGSGAPGASVTTTEVTLTPGSHYVRVLPQTGVNTGLGELIAVFIGEDTPLAPTNVVLTETRLSWDAVTKGLHGDVLEGVVYDVYFGTRLVETTSETSMSVEDIIDLEGALAPYQAEVFAKCGSVSSKGALSNTCVAGKSYTVPFTIEPTQVEFNMCVQEDTDGNNVFWSYDKRKYDDHSVFTSGFGKDMETEDWIFLPRFAASANKIYTLSFNVNIAYTDYKGGKVEAWIGTSPSSEDMKVCVIPSMAIYDYSPFKLSGSFMIPEEIASAGNYYIGLGVKSEQGTLSPLQFETIKVVETSDNMSGPEAVSKLAVSPVEGKPLQTELSFVLPDRTLDGKSIPATHIVSAEISTSNGQSKTVTGTPGEAQSVKLDLGQGDFLLTVTPSVSSISGLPANIVVSLGFDLPGMIRNLRAEYNETNTGLTLRWDAPATDMQGTPSDDDILDYNVYTFDASEDAYVLQVTVPYPLTYATMQMSENTTLSNLEVAVAAVNMVGQSPLIARTLCQVGKPYDLPMKDDLNGDYFEFEPITQYVGGGYEGAQILWGAATNTNIDLSPAMAVGDVGDVLAGIPSEPGAKSRILFPKFSTLGINEVECNLHLWCGADAATVKVGATAFPMSEEQELMTIPSREGYDWISVALPAEMCNDYWVALGLYIEYPTLASRFVLAGYNFDKKGSVEGVSDTLFGSIFGGEGCVTICGYEGKLARIYSLDGHGVAVERLGEGLNKLIVPSGVYVVKVADRTAKVVVR